MKTNKIKANQVNMTEKAENLQINYNEDKTTSKKSTNFWGSGLLVIVFYLFTLGSLIAFKLLEINLYFFPLVILGTILIFTVSGAFSLRDNDKLSQKNFLELMSIVFKKLTGLSFFVDKNKTTKND